MRTLMKVLKNLFGNNTKISADNIAVKDSNGKSKTLSNYLSNNCSNVFSTSETIIGCNEDGRKIYRKCFNGKSDLKNEVKISISSLNIDYIINAYGFVKSTYGQWWSINTYYGSDIPYWCCFNYVDGSHLSIPVGTYYSYPKYNITIEYVKKS